MGLGAAPPPPEWTGIDKVVRSYLPYDYQSTSGVVLDSGFQENLCFTLTFDFVCYLVSAAILGVYSGIFVLYKIKSAFTRKPVEAAPELEATTP